MKSIQTRAFGAAMLLFVGLWAVALPASAREIKKPEFTVTLPDDWKEVPPDVMAASNAGLRKLTPGGHPPQFAYGFQTRAAKEWLAYPYILVQIDTGERIPESVLKQARTIDMNKEMAKNKKNLPSLLSKYSIGAPVYDPSTNMLWLSGTVSGKGGLETRILSVIVPTRKGFVQFAATTTTADFEKAFPLFRRVLSSVVVPEADRY